MDVCCAEKKQKAKSWGWGEHRRGMPSKCARPDGCRTMHIQIFFENEN